MLRRWSPFEAVDRDLQDIRRAFGEFGTALLGDGNGGQATRSWVPPLDLYTQDNTVFVRLELPGINPESDVDIEFTDGVLTVSGERRHEATDQDTERGWWRREISYGRFSRSVQLPQGTDASQIRATYDAGVLTVAVPLPEKPTSKVKVEIGGSTHKELSN